jgi:hypothetical protein
VTSLTTRTVETHRSWTRHLCCTTRRNSTFDKHHRAHSHHYHHDCHHSLTPKDELAVIKRKLHNLKREKKAFRTLVLILGALLICWLPFFVTLPVISILKVRGIITDANTENIWFKIAFWLGYCNSAVRIGQRTHVYDAWTCSMCSCLVQSICLRIFESCYTTSISTSDMSPSVLLLLP